MVSIVVSLISQVFLIEVSRVVNKQPCTERTCRNNPYAKPSVPPQKKAVKQQLFKD
jgi:hypothetical protein